MPLGYYDVGATPFFALQADQRVSYCLHVPESLKDDQDRSSVRLIVAMHGTGRTATAYRDGFADLDFTPMAQVDLWGFRLTLAR